MPLKPTIPEVVAAFADYQQRPENGAWGSLHIVLEDGNCKDSSARFCAQYAKEKGDVPGERLANILLQMSPSQRGRLSRKVDEWLKKQRAETAAFYMQSDLTKIVPNRTKRG